MLSATQCHIQFTVKAGNLRREWMPALDGEMKEIKDSKRVINRLIMWKVPASPLSISAKSAAVIRLPLIECDSELC